MKAVGATPQEREEARAGDEIVAAPDVVMDRAFTVPGAPTAVWPWLVQLGKRRAGWYLPTGVELLIPRGRRAARVLDPRWQSLEVGDVIPDYGGRDETLTVAGLLTPRHLVYVSRRSRTQITWSITLRPVDGPDPRTRVLLRLRMAPVRRVLLARTLGELVDLLTILGLAAGLRERLTPR
ncbi:hypothetical protein PZ938_06900 [Luteipulveratus sp. YIM 133132]|uniref:hypothetical protein n=1 Tax=Luteipulveratus flavus TaxID=3031728 RepID=UPI0023B1EC49|nr:hypothetical protein [Luteipulveratus sp. YIM 133132]MDE9365331.1 hypothetical protein [Luteipulveratus sp. YIM 133132]